MNKRALRAPLSIRAPRCRAADKGARNADRPNSPKRNKKGGFHVVFALRSSGFAAFLLVFVRFRQRKIAPYASIGARLHVFDCLPPQGYAANRFRRRCVKGLMSRSHLMTLSKITYFTT